MQTAFKSFHVECANEKERNAWVAAIVDARQNHRQKGSSASGGGGGGDGSSNGASSAANKLRKATSKLRLKLRRPGASAANAADAANGGAGGGGGGGGGGGADTLEEQVVMAPVLASRKDCAVCGIVFSFLHQNRHKMKFCKSCGEGVCHVCSLHKIPLTRAGAPVEEEAVAVYVIGWDGVAWRCCCCCCSCCCCSFCCCCCCCC